MRRYGKITKWNDDRGFGFITPKGGGERVFVHITSFSDRRRRPNDNEIVTYEAVFDNKGRIQAGQVEYISENTTVPAQGWIWVIVLFLIFVVVLVLVGQLSFVVLLLYLVFSACSFFAYQHDKSAAQSNQWRTPESTLHILSILGGWPGALLAQKMFRHKSRKVSFQLVFWITVALNCVGVVWFSRSGVDLK